MASPQDVTNRCVAGDSALGWTPGQAAHAIAVWRTALTLGAPGKYARRSVIFSQGDMPREMFLVARGAARLSFSEPDGREILVALRYPGQFVDLGPRGIARAYPLSATALVTSEIYGIDVAAIRQAQQRNCDLGIQDTDLLRSDLDNLVAGFVRLKLLSPVDRLEQLLRDLAAVLRGQDSSRRARVVLPLDNIEMASLCGLSESHYKAVRHELEKSGRVRREGRNAWVLTSNTSGRGQAAEAQWPRSLRRMTRKRTKKDALAECLGRKATKSLPVRPEAPGRAVRLAMLRGRWHAAAGGCIRSGRRR